MPKATPGDPIFDRLTQRGLYLPEHSTDIGSAIATDSHYDQIAFFPGGIADRMTGKAGIFDFDGAIFAYLRYYISDHRLLWVEFAV